MRILYVHNKYGKPSGEEHAASELVSLLQEHGHEVRWFTRSSEEIDGRPFNLMKSFFTGIYNPWEARRLAQELDEYKPDMVQVQNLYPFLSPSIFKPLNKRRIPVVMRCPNYRLFCPYGLAMTPDCKVCERCFHGNEWNCVRYNCASGRFKSLGYAVRNKVARHFRWILDGVDVFIVQSEFQKRKFVHMGIPEKQVAILPGISPTLPPLPENPPSGDYVAYVGRISAEKGFDDFIEAARLLPDLRFKAAGSVNAIYRMPPELPDNLELAGFKKGNDLDHFFREASMVVIPSRCYEGFPNIILRSWLFGKPVICSDIGAMQDIIQDGSNGLKFSPGDPHALAGAINKISADPGLSRLLGQTGKGQALDQYSRTAIYDRLISIYKTAMHIRQENHQA